ncbi:MAG: GNAT family N-acetyltransferase [Clostridia bacterium]
MIEYRIGCSEILPGQLEGFCAGWENPLTGEEHLKALKNSRHVVLAFDTEKNRVVGFINALGDGVRFAFIPMLEVLPEYRKRGIGSHLVKVMMGLLDEVGCIDLTCDAYMQGFYDRFGMEKSTGMIVRRGLKKEEKK